MGSQFVETHLSRILVSVVLSLFAGGIIYLMLMLEILGWAKEQSAKSIVEWFDRFSKMALGAKSLL